MTQVPWNLNALCKHSEMNEEPSSKRAKKVVSIHEKLKQYERFHLKTDLPLSDDYRELLSLLAEAAKPMHSAYWAQVYGSRDELLKRIGLSDPQEEGSDGAATVQYIDINGGPWDALEEDQPFLPGVNKRPPGVQLYPHDMTKEEFQSFLDAHPDSAKQFKSPYTVIRRANDPSVPQDKAVVTVDGLSSIPYNVFYRDQLTASAAALDKAIHLIKTKLGKEEEELQRYLELRRAAFLDTTEENFYLSDVAWMMMKSNHVDLVFGPIENYIDGLNGYKAAFEAYVLVKDLDWSAKLKRYCTLLPALQRDLPVPSEYKQESPGMESELNAYDVVFVAGETNVGYKTIAINLPNDDQVQLKYGARRLQLKNAMLAKYQAAMVPITQLLVAPDQASLVNFHAFFSNVMFHEVAHGLGIKNTINGKGSVRQCLQEVNSSIEEGKADILGLWLILRLFKQGLLAEHVGPNGEGKRVEEYLVTFVAGIFRSVRFGANSAHGKANMICFNFLQEHGAISRDEKSGTYSVDFDRMQSGTEALAGRLLQLQGDGDLPKVRDFVARYGTMESSLVSDLGRLSEAGVPVDIIFEMDY